MKRILAIGIILLFIGSVCSSTGFNFKEQTISLDGKILYVGGSGPGNYSKIQDAINDSSEGDTVFVYNDSSPYYEYKIVISKSITLIGEEKNTTIIDGNENGDSVIKIFADETQISGFTIKNGWGGFFEDAGIEINSNFSTISGNIISDNVNGIISNSNNNITILDNIISNNEITGIWFEESSNNTMTNNYISNIGVGLYLCSSKRNTIADNSFFNDGISVSNSYQNSIYNNTVNDKPLIYLEKEGDKIIDNAGQIVLVNCTNISIQNQKFSNTDICIELLNTNNCLISGNFFNSNDYGGIMLSHSSNNCISNNKISENNWGIGLTKYSNNSIIFNNTISNNTNLGFVIQNSFNNTISDNKISNHTTGLELADSDYNSILDNLICDNEVGINLYSSSTNNVIYHNNLNNNSQNAFDKCTNLWDDGYPSGGNYWDDYNGTDADKDGIGDIPYNISGGNNQDRYPLMKPFGKNKPPHQPIVLGHPYGKPGIKYNIRTQLIDGDGDSIFCMWDWGDDSYSAWLGPFESGKYISASHAWSKGIYEIRVKAKDSNGAESNWSDSLALTIENEPPTVNIIKPEKALYIRNRKILPIFIRKTLILRKIDIIADAQDSSGIKKVEFYIDNELRTVVENPPYIYTWTRDKLTFLKHRHTIKIIAVDNAGNIARDEMKVRKYL